MISVFTTTDKSRTFTVDFQDNGSFEVREQGLPRAKILLDWNETCQFLLDKGVAISFEESLIISGMGARLDWYAEKMLWYEDKIADLTNNHSANPTILDFKKGGTA